VCVLQGSWEGTQYSRLFGLLLINWLVAGLDVRNLQVYDFVGPPIII
jgi:hypothetical protein